MTKKFIVEYYESEAGWGVDSWKIAYDTKEEALEAAKECNDEYMGKSQTPSYYIKATYIGEM